MIAYRLLRTLGRIALRWYYRDIEVLDADRIPLRGPVLLASNHPNALVDALVIGCSLRRPVTLTAKATLLEHPVTRMLLRVAGVVPLQRLSDVQRGRERAGAPPDPARNTRAFTAVLDRLERGGMVLLFPEGKSHSEPELAPLKTGLARMALMARDERQLRDVPIIPIGLMFEQKSTTRSRVVMQIGAPIIADEAPGTGEAVARLTQRIEAGLRDVTLNFRSSAEGQRVVALALVLAGLFDRFRPLHDPDPPLGGAVRLARRIFDIARNTSRLPAAVAQRIGHFTDRFAALENALAAHRIPAGDLQMSTALAPAAWFAIRELAIALIAGPFALWGRLNHWLPLRLAGVLGSRSSTTPEEPAMRTIVLGLVLVLGFYVAQTATVTWAFGWRAGLLYLASLPPSATWDIQYADRLRRAVLRIGVFWRFRRQPELRRAVLGEAAWIRAEAHAIDSLVADTEAGLSGGVPTAI